MAFDSDQNRLRHATASPSSTWLPRASSPPVQRSAFASRPTMKSSFTAKRVQPWNWKPLVKPERG